MRIKRESIIYLFLASLALLAACTVTDVVDPAVVPDNPDDRIGEDPGPGIKIAALDYDIDDLSDPEVLAKYARAELLIVATWQFWDRDNDLSLLRAANPNQKIIAYFRTKCVREEWSAVPPEGTSYQHSLYEAARPYLSYTTEGDTISDWPHAMIFDYTNPAAREAMIKVFAHYQATSPNKFDGVFWDYFAPQLWIAPTVTGMNGEPDMDGDGVPHWEDEDELAAFVSAQDDWVEEMRDVMGDEFIQIANGVRAAKDSTFASKFDGMFYEIFPELGFNGTGKFKMALDPSVPNNLFAAHHWPRTRNGGPWLILSQMHHIGTYQDENGVYQDIDGDDFTRIMALMTDATAITYEGFGVRDAGIPAIEYALGLPTGGVVRSDNIYTREFENGKVELFMGSGEFPLPFEFRVTQGGQVIHDMDLPTIDREP